MFHNFHIEVKNENVTRNLLNFDGFIEGLVTFTFPAASIVTGTLMGSLELGDLASASQDGSILQD